jgi:hypothetical protein
VRNEEMEWVEKWDHPEENKSVAFFFFSYICQLRWKISKTSKVFPNYGRLEDRKIKAVI